MQATADIQLAATVHMILRSCANIAPESDVERHFTDAFRSLNANAKSKAEKFARRFAVLADANGDGLHSAFGERLSLEQPITRQLIEQACRIKNAQEPEPLSVDAVRLTKEGLLLLGNNLTAAGARVTLHSPAEPQGPALPVRWSQNGAILFEFDHAGRDREHEIAVSRTIKTQYVHHESTVIVPFAADYLDQAPFQHIPTIVSIAPLGRRPSESIKIFGDHFDVFDGRRGCTVYISAIDDPDGFSTHVNVASVHSSNGWSALLVSTTEIELRLGTNIPAGRYAVKIGNGIGFSSADVYQVAPWTYQVNLVEFRCIDESNESSASDEIVTFWAAAADADIYSGNTDEYEGVDAGGTYRYRQEERRLFGPFWKPVEKAITVVIKLSEWDAGLPPGSKRVVSKDQGGQIIVLLGWVALIPKLQVIALVAIATIALIDALVSLDDDPDPLGSAELLLSAEELLMFTMNNERRYNRVFGFINADSEGSHLVTIEFLRGA